MTQKKEDRAEMFKRLTIVRKASSIAFLIVHCTMYSLDKLSSTNNYRLVMMTNMKLFKTNYFWSAQKTTVNDYRTRSNEFGHRSSFWFVSKLAFGNEPMPVWLNKANKNHNILQIDRDT